jgi:hypothetical protein
VAEIVAVEIGKRNRISGKAEADITVPEEHENAPGTPDVAYSETRYGEHLVRPKLESMASRASLRKSVRVGGG